MSNFAGMAATKNSLGSFSERTAWWTAGPKRCSSASTASLHMHVLNEFEVGIASWRKFGQNVRKYQLLHWSATHSALQDCAPAASGISFNDSDGLFKCFIRYICFHMCWFDWLIYDSGFSCCRICGEFRLHFCAHQLCSWFLSQLIPLAVWRTSTLFASWKARIAVPHSGTDPKDVGEASSSRLPPSPAPAATWVSSSFFRRNYGGTSVCCQQAAAEQGEKASIEVQCQW